MQDIFQKKIVFFICENMLATSISLPMEQLCAANAFAHSPSRTKSASSPALKIILASIDGKAKTAHTGLSIQADCSIEDVCDADLVYLPALWRNPLPILQGNRLAVEWLEQKLNRQCLIAGVGTGCCFLAEAGLLNGKSATTHWHYFDQFEKRYPQVNLQRQYFITQAGRFFCTGSVNSLADLTIHLIRGYFSDEVAAHVERHFFHDIRSAYDQLALRDNLDHLHPDEAIAEIQLWIKENFLQNIEIKKLALHYGISRRHLDRRFKLATGLSPLAYVQKLRMQNAKELLKNSNLTIHEVMYRSGYHDSSYFGSLFKKQFGTTPKQYRTTVRAKLFNLDNNSK